MPGPCRYWAAALGLDLITALHRFPSSLLSSPSSIRSFSSYLLPPLRYVLNTDAGIHDSGKKGGGRGGLCSLGQEAHAGGTRILLFTAF